MDKDFTLTMKLADLRSKTGLTSASITKLLDGLISQGQILTYKIEDKNITIVSDRWVAFFQGEQT